MYVGVSVLWYSKLLVNQFVYDFLFQIFKHEGNYLLILLKQKDIQICYTDTDSLYIHFKRDNYDMVMEKMKKHHDYERFMQIDANDLTPGKMKIESKLKEAVFLSPKCYTKIKLDEKTEIKNKVKLTLYLSITIVGCFHKSK
jgi:DNA polymerase elongation subunit (family B)